MSEKHVVECQLWRPTRRGGNLECERCGARRGERCRVESRTMAGLVDDFRRARADLVHEVLAAVVKA